MHQLETAAGKAPTTEMMEALATVLGVSLAFFSRPLPGGIAPEHFHFRKQATTPQAVVQQVLARGTLLGMAITALAREVVPSDSSGSVLRGVAGTENDVSP